MFLISFFFGAENARVIPSPLPRFFRYLFLMMLKALLARGADPLALDEDGNGALHFIAFWDDCDEGMEETELTVFKRMASLMMEHARVFFLQF